MKVTALSSRARRQIRTRRLRTLRDAKVRPVQPDGRTRYWSLMLPPGFPPDHK